MTFEKKKFRLQISLLPTHKGCGDAHLQPVHSELHDTRSSSRNNNISTCWQELNAHAGINEEQDAVDQERDHSTIDSKYIGLHAVGAQNSTLLWLKHWAVQHQLVLANTFFQKKNEAKHHTTQQNKASNWTSYSQAELFFRRCRNAETAGQVNMNSNHEAVIASIELPTESTTKQNGQ